MWDALLECRIRLHKALVAANCLPLPETWQSLINTSSPLSLDSFQEESNHSVAELTQSLLQLHTLLAKNLTVKERSTKKKHVRKEVNDEKDEDSEEEEIEEEEDEEEEKASEGSEEIGEDALDGDELHDLQENSEGQTDQEEKDSQKLYSMDVEEVNEGKTENSDTLVQVNDVPSIDLLIQRRMEEFTPKKNYILQEWFHRTRFSAAQGLESFEQPPLTQIMAILGNKKRLIKRTQLKRCQYNIIGKCSQESSSQDEKNYSEQSPCGTNGAKSTSISDIVAHESNVDAKELNYDCEIFNDDDFYHQLLKELIDSKTSESVESISLSKRWLAIQKMRGKMRKVDTRASKGRKIRFKVHKEIVNFMAPVPLTSIDESARDQIFSSIFSS